MAGKRSVFEKHLKTGHDYAWEGHWDRAIPEYQRALEESPEDVAALSSLAQAFVEAGRTFEAITTYGTIARLTPEDPLPLRRMAQLEEAQGHTDAAVEAYTALAEVYREIDMRQAVEAWEHAIRLAPDHLAARQRLAAVYEQLRIRDKAAAEHVAMADILQRMGQIEKAVQQCRQALSLEPDNRAARSLMENLRSGGKAQPAAAEKPAESAPQREEAVTPADETQQKALTELAGVIFEERLSPPAGEPVAAEDRTSVDALISQALGFQTRGLVDDAIHSYLKVINKGEDRPAVHFNLGLLFQQRLRFDEAIEHLQRSVRDPEYRLGSHFALGEVYRAQGQLDKALEHFLEVIKIVDLQTVGRDQADDLIQLYESLAESYYAKGESERAQEFADSLVQFLSNRGWQDKVREARSRLSAAVDGVMVTLAELLSTPDSEAVVKALSLSQEYMKRGLHAAASDEAYRAVELAPWYLPAHLRLADIWLDKGDLTHAIEKYRRVADVYLVRGQPARAVAVYRRLLQVNPADTAVRARCIELLEQEGDYEGALEQYIAQMEMLTRIAQVEQAMSLADKALALVREKSLGERWQAAVLHQVGEIQVGRVAWKDALKTYRTIKMLSPADERARVRIIDLQYKMSQDREALAELDELAQLYRGRGEHQRVLTILRELVDLRPQAAELHVRLAEAYHAAGMLPKAVEEWDMAARILWNAGRTAEARELVQRIIRLDPANVEEFRTRLRQMGG